MKLYTTAEVADRLGVSPRTVQDWIQQGMFPNAFKLKPGGVTSPYRIPEEDVAAFEEKRERQSGGTK